MGRVTIGPIVTYESPTRSAAWLRSSSTLRSVRSSARALPAVPVARTRFPAVVYGHGAEPVHINLPGHDLLMALRTPNVLIGLDIDGKDALVDPEGRAA